MPLSVRAIALRALIGVSEREAKRREHAHVTSCAT